MSRRNTSAPSATGYSDRISYRQGERVELKAAGRGPADLDLVRLHRPPDAPESSLPCFSVVDTVPAQRIQLTPQETHAGSYLTVDALPLAPAIALTGSAYVLPTMLAAGHLQGLWSLHGTDGGVALLLDPQGELALAWDTGGQPSGRLASPVGLVEGRWHVVSWSIDPAAGEVSLAHRLVAPAPRGLGCWSGSLRAEGLPPAALAQLHIGAARVASIPAASALPGSPSQRTSFNGKIDAPVLVASPIPARELALATPEQLRGMEATVAAWDFSQEQSTARAVDTGPHGLHGLLVNSPARAMTGVHWEADEQRWIHAPQQYSAVYFHEDDLDDARWSVVATVDLPAGLPTGVYALRLREVDVAEPEEELVTVVVVPRGSRHPDVRTLVVLPTYTYIAYANLLGNGEKVDYVAAGLAEGPAPAHAGQERLAGFPEIAGSTYDVHNDGSGRCYSTPRRPILNLKLDWKSSRRDAYRHMAADLYIPTWLESLGIPYDVTTDHVVNEAGAAAMEGYSVVLTGTHPEYISRQIIDAMRAHLDAGGCLLYLGGNGFYWVTTESTDIPELLEVRRGFQGTRTWTGAAGESYHSQTGELGGLWRLRGRPPHALLGVGFAAQGADGGAAGYRRAAGALDGDAGFLFEGVTADVFGTTGYDMGGAAGDEVDRFDVRLGSPPWGVVAASSLPLSTYYKLAIEDIQMTRENTGGDHETDVRADLVVTEDAAGGFVFATGSISWVQSMAVDGFDNDVARITENALRAALSRAKV